MVFSTGAMGLQFLFPGMFCASKGSNNSQSIFTVLWQSYVSVCIIIEQIIFSSLLGKSHFENKDLLKPVLEASFANFVLVLNRFNQTESTFYILCYIPYYQRIEQVNQQYKLIILKWFVILSSQVCLTDLKQVAQFHSRRRHLLWRLKLTACLLASTTKQSTPKVVVMQKKNN